MAVVAVLVLARSSCLWWGLLSELWPSFVAIFVDVVTGDSIPHDIVVVTILSHPNVW